MAREKICGIYKITSPSGKFYIGSTVDIYGRWHGHKSDLRKRKHHCDALQKAANKYGIDNLVFELLEKCSFDTLRDVEQRYINALKPSYNSSSYTKEPLSELWNNDEFRNAGIEKAKKQAAEWRKDPEWQKKQKHGASKALAKLHTDPDFQIAHKKRATERIMTIVNSSDEMKAKAADARRKKIADDKADPDAWEKRNAKIRELLNVPIICVETGMTFSSHKDAGNWLRDTFGFKTNGHISSAISGRVKTAYGFHWEKVNG